MIHNNHTDYNNYKILTYLKIMFILNLNTIKYQTLETCVVYKLICLHHYLIITYPIIKI